MRLKRAWWLWVLCSFFFLPNVYGYSVLTHEAIVDSAWKDNIEPLLKQRFPRATAEDLKAAHAYAYGGCIIQDMGYYPLGSKFFTDLTHYVRSGTFVASMLRNSVTLYEYAFALGALAHYASDTSGHPLGTNRAVPLLYPKLERRFGKEVTYEDNPGAHLKTEFGFDVLEVAKGRYAPDTYHDFIGFQVAKPLLGRAFQQTYGLELDDVFSTLDLAIGTYRKSVSALIPKMTKVAWALKQDEIQKSQPGVSRQKFLYNLSRSEYERSWGTQYRAPGFGSRILALIIVVIPKVGPFSALSFRTPTPEAEKFFMDSFNATLDRYRPLLEAERAGRTLPADLNLDVGSPTVAGKYRLADGAYAKLVDKFAKKNFAGMPPELRANVLSFYMNEDALIATKRNKKQWAKLNRELDVLRTAPRQ
jgi:hypothetical protein